METVENKCVTVAYKLYTMGDDEKELFEEAKVEYPFQSISGLGTTLEGFENQIAALSKSDKPDFVILTDKAYGQYDEQRVIDFPKSIFEMNNKFDSERIKKSSIVPSTTDDGQRTNASIVEVEPGIIVADLNHPLASADLIFEGGVLESRLATNEETQELVKMMSGGDDYGCGYDSCSDGCSDDCGCEDGHCH